MIQNDLTLTRLLRAPPAAVWRCWTEPALLEQWFAPKPVVTRDVVIDLRPGGAFATTMDVPDHGTQSGEGCFLEIIPERRLVWTDMLSSGFRPVEDCFGFTAILTFAPEDGGTRYTATAMHRSAEISRQHEEMGFHTGWGVAADQLEALARTL